MAPHLRREGVKRFFRNNGLSVVLTLLFFIFWGAQAYFGWRVYNEELGQHHLHLLAFRAYLFTGHFWGSTGENWESEFLQMGAYVILTTFLYQKGSAESNDPDNTSKANRPHGFLYRNSLSLAFFALFWMSVAIHFSGALVENNDERVMEGLQPQTFLTFLGEPTVWFQSFQNWQSEFLAVLSIVTLTIFLRQKGSPESKELDEPNSKTGK